MHKKTVLGMAAMTAAAMVGMASTGQAAPTAQISTTVMQAKVAIPVVAGAKALTSGEKFTVDGAHCGCPETPPPAPTPTDTKPGYGFGTTGHYGPPGQGFTSTASWRMTVARGGTTTPKGGNLPPRAFR